MKQAELRGRCGWKWESGVADPRRVSGRWGLELAREGAQSEERGRRPCLRSLCVQGLGRREGRGMVLSRRGRRQTREVRAHSRCMAGR